MKIYMKIKTVLGMGCLAGMMAVSPVNAETMDHADSPVRKGREVRGERSDDGGLLRGPKVNRNHKEDRDFKGRRRKGMGGKGMKHMRGRRRGGEQLLKALALSADQKKAIRKNIKDQHLAMKKFMAKHKAKIAALYKRMREAKKNKDRKAMKALMKERKALFAQAPKQNRMAALKSVLSDEQLGKLADLIAKRKAEAKKRQDANKKRGDKDGKAGRRHRKGRKGFKKLKEQDKEQGRRFRGRRRNRRGGDDGEAQGRRKNRRGERGRKLRNGREKK